MLASETIIGIFTGLILFLRFILEIKEQKDKEKRIGIDEALATNDEPKLDALLDDQHYRVSQKIHECTCKK